MVLLHKADFVLSELIDAVLDRHGITNFATIIDFYGKIKDRLERDGLYKRKYPEGVFISTDQTLVEATISCVVARELLPEHRCWVCPVVV